MLVSPGELRHRLDALNEARRAGDGLAAERLRRELARDRLWDRVELGPVGPSELRRGDVDLLIQIGDDFARSGEYDRALDLLRAAFDFARHLESPLWIARAVIHGVFARCAALQFAHAADELHALFGVTGGAAALNGPAALASAASLAAADAQRAELDLLRAEAVYGLAQYRAATGALADADAALVTLLEMLEHVDGDRIGTVSRGNVALLLAELRLDCGDVAGWDRARALAASHGIPPAQRPAWECVDGLSLFLQGRMSEARARLEAVDAAPDDGQTTRRYRRIARWYLAQVLAVLNCMDAADAALRRFAEDGSEEDVIHLRRLFASKRSGVGAAVVPHTTPRDFELDDGLLVAELRADVARPSAASSGQDSDAATSGKRVTTRTCERVHDEWANASNAVQADLADHRFAEANARLRALTAWMPVVQSPLIQARFLRLCALVASFDDMLVQDGTCEQLADAARATFQRLDMPLDAWHASRIRARALDKQSADRSAVDAELQRAHDLLRRVQQGLSAFDRTMFLLNKWSTIDDAIEARLNAERMVGGVATSVDVRLLHELAQLKRWQAPSRQPAGEPAPEVPAEISDVFTWVQQQARVQSRRIGRFSERVMPRRAYMRRDTAVVQYIALPGRIEAFVLVRDGCARLCIAGSAGRHEVFATAMQALRDLAETDAPWARLAEASGALDRLGRMLGLPELSSWLPPGVRQLVVALDETLVHVPFAALPFRGRPLVDAVGVAVTPYAVWTEHAIHARRRFSRVLGVAVPHPPYTLTDASGQSWEYDTLGEPSRELGALTALSRAAPIELRDDAATVDKVLEHLADCDLAHFICHGDFLPGVNEPGRLLLWDRTLNVAHIQKARMPRLRFVGTGACWTANARVLPGREIVGIPAAFLERGVDTVLGSLWSVGDEDAARFAKALYAAARTMAPVDAIAHVQRAWSRERPAHEWALYQTYVRGVEPRPGIRVLMRAGQMCLTALHGWRSS